MNETPGHASDESLVDDSPAETSAQMGEAIGDQDSEPSSVRSGAAADEGERDDQDSGPSPEPAGTAETDADDEV